MSTQGNLLDDLVGKPQRETAGSSSASRFDYQKNWAFCEMLSRHMDSADYLVAFEFHDDVVFLEPDKSPASADFVQVKTSTSAAPRKTADLVSRKKLKDSTRANSIIGKMCQNFDGICSGHNLRILLVSNVAFEFSDKDICVKDIAEKHRNTIREKLKEEVPSLTDEQFERLHFMISGVSIDAMQTYLNGQAMELFKSHFGEDHGLNVHSWVRLVQGDIARKNNFPSDKIESVDDLVAKKCISRSYILDTLGVVSKTKRALDMTLVNNELSAAGWSAIELVRLGKFLPQATYDFTDASNAEVQDIISKLGAIFDHMDDGNINLAAYCEKSANTMLSAVQHPYNNKAYITALAILVLYEKI